MSWLQILRLPLGLPATRLGLLGLAWVLAIAAMLLPYDHDKHIPHDGKNSRLVLTVEYGLRHVNTALQLGLPLLTRDWTGLRQLAVVAIAAGGTVHGLKRALNDVEIAGTRLPAFGEQQAQHALRTCFSRRLGRLVCRAALRPALPLAAGADHLDDDVGACHAGRPYGGRNDSRRADRPDPDRQVHNGALIARPLAAI